MCHHVRDPVIHCSTKTKAETRRICSTRRRLSLLRRINCAHFIQMVQNESHRAACGDGRNHKSPLTERECIYVLFKVYKIVLCQSHLQSDECQIGNTIKSSLLTTNHSAALCTLSPWLNNKKPNPFLMGTMLIVRCLYFYTYNATTWGTVYGA